MGGTSYLMCATRKLTQCRECVWWTCMLRPPLQGCVPLLPAVYELEFKVIFNSDTQVGTFCIYLLLETLLPEIHVS